jgi:hypothetical protein
MRYAIVLATLAFLFLIADSADAVTIRHRFDMEPVGNTTTEPGWTHMDHTINYVAGVSGGFDVANSLFYGTFNYSPASNPPFLMRSDATIGRGAEPADNSVRVIFHDIVPVYATEATYAIYRDSPGDNYLPNWTVDVFYNNGVATNSHTSTGAFTSEHLPITGMISWGGLPLTPGTLEFEFIDTTGGAGSSAIRIAGIDILYTPEPASALALTGVAMLLARRGHRPRPRPKHLHRHCRKI